MGWQQAVLLTLAVVQVLGSEYLLPTDVHPTHYDLSFIFSVDPLEKFAFFGVAKIHITASKETSKIILHGQNFVIANERVSLQGPGAGKVPVSKVQRNDTFNLVTFALGTPLRAGLNYTLHVPFSGNLKNDLDGVYLSNYVDKTTKKKEYLIVTQFEAISARKGFPCFDEPMYKATFRITIGHRREFTAVSNMPVFNTTQDSSLTEYWPWEEIETKIKSRDDILWDHFENSVPMSTYLVAWVVSKFRYHESPADLSLTRFRIWARADALDQTEYAAAIGPRILSYYERWFNVSFPLPKQDMLAIPDFAAGAMENWGLITYRETALLYDKRQSSFLNKERVAEVIAHELAHQWFGNLVTMKWWSDLWLNEGFATYVASVGTRAVEPEWKSQDTDAVTNMLAILNLDSLQSSHPVSVKIDDPKRINEIFDEISYKKGAILIRMMVMFLGEDVFRKGINNYLVKYSYSNAEQDDLWSELTKVAKEYNVLSRKDVTVKDIMDTWTKQTGYPLLTVRREYPGNTLVITQKRYLALGASAPTKASWWVPLNVVCQNEGKTANREKLEWLAAGEGGETAHRFEHGANDTEWVLFNADMLAEVRVDYDERNWALLSATLNSDQFDTIPTLSRVQLLADSFALAWSNVLDYKLTLKLANYLQQEVEYVPVETALSALGKIDVVLSRSPDYGAFQKYVRKLIAPVYERAGGIYAKKIVDPDDMLSVKLQGLSSRWACRVKVPGCEENAIEMFARWMDSDTPDSDNPIPLDLRSTVLCTAVSRGGAAHWRFLLARVQATNVAAARNTYLSAMACSRDIWILKQYLEWAVTPGSEVRPQDAGTVIVNIMRSQVGYYVAREFVLNRIDDLYKTFNAQSRRLGHIIKAMLDQFTSQKELDEFMIWKKANEKYFDEAKLAVQQAIEKATVNIGWLEKNRAYVVEKMRELSV